MRPVIGRMISGGFEKFMNNAFIFLFMAVMVGIIKIPILGMRCPKKICETTFLNKSGLIHSFLPTNTNMYFYR